MNVWNKIKEGSFISPVEKDIFQNLAEVFGTQAEFGKWYLE